MLIGSIAFLLLNVVLISTKFREHASRARTGRVFTGFLMVMAGLVALTTVVLFSITLFKKAESDKDIAQRADELKLYGSWALYYVAAYVGATWWLSRGARGETA